MNSTREGRKLGLALGGGATLGAYSRTDSTQIGELIDEGYKAACAAINHSDLCVT